MKIAFCTPFKPLTHPRISGDVTIAEDLATFFQNQGHEIWIVPQLSTRYIWKRPRNWGHIYATMQLVKENIQNEKPDVWFTYHSYYKAPDILGTMAAREQIPYAIFAPSHAPKRKKDWSTKPGYYLNKKALQHATHIFANKQRDLEGLSHIVPPSHLTFIPPGIRTDIFTRNETLRAEKRTAWNATDSIVVLTIAMLRKGTKSEGVEHVITACSDLAYQGHDIKLIIAGDGVMRPYLEEVAHKFLPNRHIFLGIVPSKELPALYSSCDIFAFPGINEGLGMVYLEAQSCGLPVVAWDHDGAPQVVNNGTTGIITPSYDNNAFSQAIGKLAASPDLRTAMGAAATKHTATNHNIRQNYAELDAKLRAIAQQ
ncbi:glycosyltransferase family 4 protein [Halodesulfovibrio aestuarii]|uniref:Glycosyltransferase involved in cell wall bisynthesis n=1 Tax=Halodesulfovibrio aestuarii TaxID=126333 RepID=A0A8G2C9I6_9BACT|nr:glycosyltransferase family 4 protein [Halodesulfovibrio aestuarii]SHJ10212.1 Glycosyltransferase involved in cell wall bisynthesis [Halodesulfovibrio aestuarii]